MRKFLVIVFSLMAGMAFSQEATYSLFIRVAATTTVFGENIPVGSLVYEATGDDLYMLPTGALNTASLSTVSDEILVNDGSGITVSGTPVDNQVGVWISASGMEGDDDLTFDGSTRTLSLGMNSTGHGGVLKIYSSTPGSISFQPATGIGNQAYTWPVSVTNTYFLQTDGSGNLSWVRAGNVDYTGTPVDNQLAVWTNSYTVEGTTSLTYASSELSVTGDITPSYKAAFDGYFEDLTTGVALTQVVSASTWYVLYNPGSGGLLTAREEINTTLGSAGTANEDKVDVTYAGDYLVTANLAFKGVNGELVAFRLNSTSVTGSANATSVTTNTENLTITAIFSLTAGDDVWVDVMNRTDTDDPTVYVYTLTIVKLWK